MSKFRDGWYAVFPDGGCYEAVDVRDDKVIDWISESQAGTHRNGSNHNYIPVHDAIDALDGLGDMFEDERGRQ